MMDCIVSLGRREDKVRVSDAPLSVYAVIIISEYVGGVIAVIPILSLTSVVFEKLNPTVLDKSILTVVLSEAVNPLKYI